MNMWASFGQRKKYLSADNSVPKLNLAQQRRKVLLPLLTWVVLGALLIVLVLNWYLFGFVIRFWVGLGAMPFLVLSLWLYARNYDRTGSILLSLVVSSTILLANLVHKFEYTGPIPYFEYITARIMLLGGAILPVVLLDIQREFRWLLACLLFNLACVLGYDALHNAFGVGFYQKGPGEPSYFYLQSTILLFWLILVIAFVFLKILNGLYEAQLTQAVEELKQRQDEIKAQNEALLRQSEHVQLINQNLAAREKQARQLNLSLEEKVAFHNQALKQINSELDMFLYRSSHDLRRPLTTLMGLAEVARSTLSEELAKDLFEKVDFTARQMDRMLTKLRMVSDINSDLKMDYIALRKIMRYTQKRFQGELEALGIDFRAQYEPSLSIWSNDTLLNAIFSNLMENSIQFCRQRDPYIEVDIRQDQENLIIFFRDNGQGIEPQYHPRLFDMYFRANEQAKGNGLGLYVVRKAVEKLRGEVSLRSHYGQWTEVKVKIPFIYPQDTEANSESFVLPKES